MPTTAITVDNEALSAVSTKIMGEWRDGLKVATGFIAAQEQALGAGKPSGPMGHTMIQGTMLNTHSDPTEVVSGFESYNLSVRGVGTPAYFNPARTDFVVLISGEEEEVNSGPESVVRIASQRELMVANEAKRKFNEQIVAGGVSGWTARWGTLNGVDVTTGNAGFLEEDARTSQANVIGNISKATYSATAAMQNAVGDFADSFNSAGLAQIHAIRALIHRYAPDVDWKKYCWLGTENFMQFYMRAIQSRERYTYSAGATYDAADVQLKLGGAPLKLDTHLPTAGTNSTANPVSLMGLSFEDIWVHWSKGKYNGYFGAEPWQDVSGQYADVRMMRIVVRGQLVYNGGISACAIGHSGEVW